VWPAGYVLNPLRLRMRRRTTVQSSDVSIRRIDLLVMQIIRYAEFLLFIMGTITLLLDRMRLVRQPINKVAVESTAAQMIAVVLMLPFVCVSFSGRSWISAQEQGVSPFPMSGMARGGVILTFCLVANKLLRRRYKPANDQRHERGDWRSEATDEAIRAEDEFRDAAQHHIEWSRKVVWSVFVSGLAGFPAALSIVLIPVRLLDRGHVTEIIAFVGLLTGTIGLVVLVVSVAAWCHEYRSKRDPRLVCPHCGGGLFTHHIWVIATKNCPRCGDYVFGDRNKGKKLPLLDPEF
jgi:ribosomal protein S27AE